MSSDEASIAWAAGLFEGEGCLYEVRSVGLTFTYLGLTIEMTDLEIMERFHNVLKNNGVKSRSRITSRWRGNENHASQYALKMSGQGASDAFALLRPYLGTRRQNRGDEILAKREASVQAAYQTRECVVCGSSFTVCLLGQTKRFCTKKCYLQHRMTLPGERERARERSRRHKAKKRAAGAFS